MDLTQNPKIYEICKSNGISYLGLFGSYARGEQTDSSDVDLLVKFSEPAGYFKLINVQETFKNILNKEVDLVTENALSKYIKPYVLNDLKTLYGSR
uniref:Polymerase beta nucleotidyltransferase domain-containing protein n=1 Tax=candidate division WWE3 bacterium TaxID=2053526 RepID=A0A7C4XGN5_UNCKA